MTHELTFQHRFRGYSIGLRD